MDKYKWKKIDGKWVLAKDDDSSEGMVALFILLLLILFILSPGIIIGTMVNQFSPLTSCGALWGTAAIASAVVLVASWTITRSPTSYIVIAVICSIFLIIFYFYKKDNIFEKYINGMFPSTENNTEQVENTSSNNPITSDTTNANYGNNIQTIKFSICEWEYYTIKYDANKISADVLNNAFNLFCDGNFSMINDHFSKLISLDDMSSKAEEEFENLNNDYDEKVQTITNLQLPESDIFEKQRKYILLCNKKDWIYQKKLFYYFVDKDKFASLIIHDSKARKYRDALVEGGNTLLEVWKEWFTEKNNGEDFYNEEMNLYNSDNAIAYAEKDILVYALSNKISDSTCPNFDQKDKFIKALKPFVEDISYICIPQD